MLDIFEMGISLEKSAKITKNESNIAIFTQNNKSFSPNFWSSFEENYLLTPRTGPKSSFLNKI